MTFCSKNNFLLMKLLPIHCSWGAPISEKRPKSRILHYITKKVDFRRNGFRAKRGAVWRLVSWGMAFLLKQFCSRTTFVYHKKFEWERYKTYPVQFVRSIAPQPGNAERKVGYQNDRWDLNFCRTQIFCLAWQQWWSQVPKRLQLDPHLSQVDFQS